MTPSKVIIKSTLTDDAPRARRWLTKVSGLARARGTGWRRLDGPGAWTQPGWAGARSRGHVRSAPSLAKRGLG